MADSADQRAWVLRVLGVAVPARGAGGGADLLKIWTDAREQVDAAIGELQSALRANGDPDLRQIAEYGLNGLTSGENVRMMAALQELKAGSPKGAAKVAGAVAAYRAFLDGKAAALLEDNPFDVPVPLRTVLGHALDQLTQSLPR
jgi:hypothetical protein